MYSLNSVFFFVLFFLLPSFSHSSDVEDGSIACSSSREAVRSCFDSLPDCESCDLFDVPSNPFSNGFCNTVEQGVCSGYGCCPDCQSLYSTYESCLADLIATITFNQCAVDCATAPTATPDQGQPTEAPTIMEEEGEDNDASSNCVSARSVVLECYEQNLNECQNCTLFSFPSNPIDNGVCGSIRDGVCNGFDCCQPCQTAYLDFEDCTQSFISTITLGQCQVNCSSSSSASSSGTTSDDPSDNDDIPTIGEYPPCSVCGDGQQITNTNASVTFPTREEAVFCANLQDGGLAGFVEPTICALLPPLINDACGCAPGEATLRPASAPAVMTTPSAAPGMANETETEAASCWARRNAVRECYDQNGCEDCQLFSIPSNPLTNGFCQAVEDGVCGGRCLDCNGNCDTEYDEYETCLIDAVSSITFGGCDNIDCDTPNNTSGSNSTIFQCTALLAEFAACGFQNAVECANCVVFDAPDFDADVCQSATDSLCSWLDCCPPCDQLLTAYQECLSEYVNEVTPDDCPLDCNTASNQSPDGNDEDEEGCFGLFFTFTTCVTQNSCTDCVFDGFPQNPFTDSYCSETNEAICSVGSCCDACQSEYDAYRNCYTQLVETIALDDCTIQCDPLVPTSAPSLRAVVTTTAPTAGASTAAPSTMTATGAPSTTEGGSVTSSTENVSSAASFSRKIVPAVLGLVSILL